MIYIIFSNCLISNSHTYLKYKNMYDSWFALIIFSRISNEQLFDVCDNIKNDLYSKLRIT